MKRDMCVLINLPRGLFLYFTLLLLSFARAIPDKWIQLLKHRRDETWSMREIVSALCNR